MLLRHIRYFSSITLVIFYSNYITLILISNFRRVLNTVLRLLGNLPASGLLVPESPDAGRLPKRRNTTLHYLVPNLLITCLPTTILPKKKYFPVFCTFRGATRLHLETPFLLQNFDKYLCLKILSYNSLMLRDCLKTFHFLPHVENCKQMYNLITARSRSSVLKMIRKVTSLKTNVRINSAREYNRTISISLTPSWLLIV